jgi:hypothetical protein
MRLVVLAVLAVLVPLSACTPRPRAARGPTFSWDTANSVVRRAPGSRAAPRPSGAPSASGEWIGTVATPAGDRATVLVLERDGRARLEFSPAREGLPDVLEGGWAREATWVRVEFFRADGEPINIPVEYDLSGNELLPVTGWDAARFGSPEPPRFARR